MKVVLFLLAASILLSLDAFAQTVIPFRSTGDITPTSGPAESRRASVTSTRVRAPDRGSERTMGASEDAIIIPKLSRIVLSVASGPDARPVLAVAEQPDLQAVFAAFVGTSLSRRQMAALMQRINAVYRSSKEPFAFAYIPPQTVRDGVLTVRVRKYTIGNIHITGNRWFSASLLRYESGLKTGLVPNFDDIQSDIDWLNRNPFRSVEVIFSPGEKTAETDADIYTDERFPVYAFGGTNNQNDPTLGRNGWFLGGSLGNFLGLDQILTYQYTRTTTERFFNHAAAWHIPLTSRDSLLLYGNYAKAHPFSSSPFSNYGGGSSISFRWVHMVSHSAFGGHFGLNGTIQLGYDWKNANSYQKIGPQDIVIGNADTNQLVFAYSGSLQDPYGKTEFNNQVVYGLPGLTRRNSQRFYQTIAPGSAPDYFYNRLSLNRSVHLSDSVHVNVKATHQHANRNLLYSEQVALGGQGTVRGYYVNTSFGSISTFFNLEAETKTFSVLHLFDRNLQKDETAFMVFWDYGNNRQAHQAVQGVHSVTLSSVGFAASSKVNHWLSGSLDVGWRLRRAARVGTRGASVDYTMTVGF